MEKVLFHTTPDLVRASGTCTTKIAAAKEDYDSRNLTDLVYLDIPLGNEKLSSIISVGRNPII